MRLDELKSFLYKERQAVDAVSTTVKQNMAAVLAIAAAVAIPAVPAMFAVNGMYNLTANWHEEWRKWAAIAVGIGIEGAGLFLSQLATKTYSAWRKKAASLSEVRVIAGTVIIYTIVSVALICFSDVPVALKIIVSFVPVLGIAFYVGVGFETDLANRLDEVADEKRRKSEVKVAAKEPQKDAVTTRPSRKEWRNYAASIVADNPQISGAELARHIGSSERSGQNILNGLKKNGHQ